MGGGVVRGSLCMAKHVKQSKLFSFVERLCLAIIIDILEETNRYHIMKNF